MTFNLSFGTFSNMDKKYFPRFIKLISKSLQSIIFSKQNNFYPVALLIENSFLSENGRDMFET